jgi:hypothetical protein
LRNPVAHAFFLHCPPQSPREQCFCLADGVLLPMSLVPRYLACFLWFRVSVAGSLEDGSGQPSARAFGHPVPHSGNWARRQVALPSSRVTPVKTCPVLRPRWCPSHSPKRVWDCCLPVSGYRRLSPPYHPWGISCCPPLYTFRGSITRPASSPPPAPYSHCWACTWSSLLTCWLGVSQVGLALAVRTHWVTTTNFMGFLPIPRFRTYLGATTAELG